MSAVPALQLPADEPAILKFPVPAIYRPPRTQDSQSCVPPSRRKRWKPAPGQETFWPKRMDPDVLAYAEATREDRAATIVPEHQREWLRQNLSVRELYRDWMLPELQRRVEKGTLARGTLEKDNQALNRWERFTRPQDWPGEKVWPGYPIGYITPKVIERFLEDLYEACPAATANSTWCHLRNILNQAVRIRAIETFPKPGVLPEKEDAKVQIYRPEQIEAGYHALRDHLDLQVAFVLAHNAGPRCVDVFLMRWDGVELDGPRPHIDFTARKTGKRQVVPLAPVTITQLRRLHSRGNSEFLFPGRSSPHSKDPEKAKPARRRRDQVKQLFTAAGITFAKPFQAARATCNTRLENWRTGVGQFVLGHALTLNARHYHEPSDLIFEAVTSIEQPACFSDFQAGRQSGPAATELHQMGVTFPPPVF